MTYLLNDKAIKKAHEAYKEFVENPELRALYESREKFRKDYNTDMALSREEGREEGIEEGIEKGREEEALEVALRMLKDGLPPESVVKYSGLSLEKVESLKREIDGESAL